ncbi:pericentrin [Scaptodrosophila lebanonensis]|uniref:Pericentrin n=1 Tax=Drosophila lebanonensis TaxID=7225 RepID=A0A6J2UC45_DROLE|nr:pericentrin [Scaptodrosophila lebanonensis]
MNLYTLYDWITSLLRNRGSNGVSYKAVEAAPSEELATSSATQGRGTTAVGQQHSQATTGRNYILQHVEVEFIPTLNFVLETPSTVGQQQTRQEQHVATTSVVASDNVDKTEADSDNDSTHTYIISRDSHSTTTTTATTPPTTSSSTPYAVTSTDTAELLRQQNNLSLTEDERTISSFTIDEPTSSITIEMADQRTTTTTTSNTTPKATSTATSAETTSSIEEEIEEAIEISEVEEDLLSGGATFPPPKSITAGESSLSELQQHPIQPQSAKTGSSDEADEFRIDDSQLSGGQLAQHFVVEDESDSQPTGSSKETTLSANDDDDEDDFDISLPLERRVVHSRHDDNDEDDIEGQAVDESLSNQSTTDDVSDLADEPRQAPATEDEQTQASSAPQTTATSYADTQGATQVSAGESKMEPSQLEVSASESRLEQSQLAATSDEANSEQDHSIEEIVATNESVEITYDGEEAVVSSSQQTVTQDFARETQMVTDLDAEEPPTVNAVQTLKLPQLQQPQVVEHKSAIALETLPIQSEPLELTILELDASEEDDEECSLQLMKLRLLAMQQQTLSENGAKVSPAESPVPHVSSSSGTVSGNSMMEIKQMERVPLAEYSKDVLEDITEESERLLSLSTTAEEEGQSLSMEDSKTLLAGKHAGSSSSLISLNMLRQLEAKVQELHTELESKDQGLASLNAQLEAARREASAGPGSARDSSSLMTNSTEYRTLQEEFGAPTLDIYVELSRRDEMIAKLSDSLQQSLNIREQLQTDADRLNGEVQSLRRQLNEAIDSVKRWPRTLAPDQESNAGQRLSEISMDLISESDDELERHFFEDHDERGSRSSRERQLSVSYQGVQPSIAATIDEPGLEPLAPNWTPAFSKQIEQFQTYLLPNEQRLFLMVQRKFDDYLAQQLEQCRQQAEDELKIARDQWETEKAAHNSAMAEMQQQRQTQQAAHAKQMEELRKYFEHKCADLEKQFSDDVFSHKSQILGGDSSSECSEAEQMPEEVASIVPVKETSPRKRKRAELLLSPSHRQMTPCGLDSLGEKGAGRDGNANISLEIADLKTFYQSHIQELKRAHEEKVRQLKERLKSYEHPQLDDDYLPTNKLMHTCRQTIETQTETAKPNNESHLTKDGTDDIEGLADSVQAVRNASLIIIDEDELNFANDKDNDNESQVIRRIIEEYERRLQEQLALARQDIAAELEQHIQNLLSENTVDDQHWPKELILLREKFTAKSQLEITQLNIKHADEMSRMKLEYEKQLNRKNKRHLTFDSARDLEHIISERDGLRELSKSFRSVLSQLAKCVANCEDDLNATLSEEVQRLLAHSRSQEGGEDQDQTLSSSLLHTSLNTSKQVRFVPDVHSLLEVVEDPSLLQFIDSKSVEEQSEDFDLNDCLERLKAEAAYLLRLSADLHHQRANASSEHLEETEKQEHELCCEAEDGLKVTAQQQQWNKFLRTNSLNDQQLGVASQRKSSDAGQGKTHSSLPPDLQKHAGNASELSFQLIELKNRLIKSETDRQNLQQQLTHTIDRNAELGQELQQLRDQLSQLSSLNHTDYAEGYGLGAIKSPQSLSVADKSSASFAQLQEKARNLLSSPTQQKPREQSQNGTVLLLQMIEDFCREGDKVVECGKRDREDLQAQIDTADKQLKATRLFLEEQAAEREQERDEFVREIERLKAQLRDKEKESSSFANASEEYAQLEAQLRDANKQLDEANSKRDKFEVELKASIDKIFVLREIISELETQVQTKALNEQVLDEKARQLEDYVNLQMRANDALQQEVHSLKTDIGEGYLNRIRLLEEKLQHGRPSAEQSLVLEQVADQLRDIETTLEQKTKTLESLHNSNTASNSGSLSVTEDVSVHGGSKPATAAQTVQGSPTHPSPCQRSLTVEGVQRVAERLDKHTRIEEATLKRMRDLEMQVSQLRSNCVELQHERDSLQGHMDEQTRRISTLQSRLEEQRERAEELHRVGTSDLSARVHELQSEVQNLKEQLTARDKQMATMRQQMERSKAEITRLESELASRLQPDRNLIERLESDIQQKSQEIHKLKEKIRNEMINRLALPDLMETMLVDKNDEIDHLREQLQAKERELQAALQDSHASSSPQVGGKQETSAKLSARTLSDIGSITEFAEPDVERRAAMRSLNVLPSPGLLNENTGGFMHKTMDTSKEAVANLTQQRTDELSVFAQPYPTNTFEHPHYFQDPTALATTVHNSSSMTPGIVPRQINFSNLTEDSKLKTPSILQQTPDLSNVIAVTPSNQAVQQLTKEMEGLRQKLANVEEEKAKQLDALEREANAHQQQIGEYAKQQSDLEYKLAHLEEQLTRERQLLAKEQAKQRSYVQSEQQYQRRIDGLEAKVLETAAKEASERESLRKELTCVTAAHVQCQQRQQDVLAAHKRQLEQLNSEVKAKEERSLQLASQLQKAQERIAELELQKQTLERELERLRQNEHSSKQYSVDEIAQQVEKELNYSAQLDSNILRAIESEEENNLDSKLKNKQLQVEAAADQAKPDSTKIPQRSSESSPGTDDENFSGERELLNQIEALRLQLNVEREQCEMLSKELYGEKQHSQEIQEQDVVIIEAMRKRLENALSAEDELHKQLDMEREHAERLQAQLTAHQRAESRRNSSMLLKSPTESPRKSPRADFESELGERLRSEIKMLTAQNERERERSADIQRSAERERQRHDKELQERVAYCERLKREMEKLTRDKDSAEQELEHYNERLTLQAGEIESLESRLATLQEAETRRSNNRARQHQEHAQLQAEVHELKSKLLAAEAARDCLEQKVTQLRFDVERSAQREAKLAEALAQANDRLSHSTDDTVPQQFLQKMKEINTLLAENTQENRQMAETVQMLASERLALQKKCEELEQGGGQANVSELEERCRQLLGRYLRVESHRKALVYQKRYLKLTLEGYQASEQMALQARAATTGIEPPQRRNKKRLFKTVALAIIAIQRIKYIGRIWHTGKRIVSKSVFTITQQRRPGLNVPPTLPTTTLQAAQLPLNSRSSNCNLPTNNNNNSNNNMSAMTAGRLSYAPVSPPLMPVVNFSSLQPMMMPHDYTLQAPAGVLHPHNNNNNSNNNNNNNNNHISHNHGNENALPSLAKLDWPTIQKNKRAHARQH